MGGRMTVIPNVSSVHGFISGVKLKDSNGETYCLVSFCEFLSPLRLPSGKPGALGYQSFCS